MSNQTNHATTIGVDDLTSINGCAIKRKFKKLKDLGFKTIKKSICRATRGMKMPKHRAKIVEASRDIRTLAQLNL